MPVHLESHLSDSNETNGEYLAKVEVNVYYSEGVMEKELNIICIRV